MANIKSRKKPKELNRKISLIIALFSILFGIALIILSSGSTISSVPKNQNSESYPPQNYPTKLYIPKIKKTLDISDGQVVDNRWTVSTTGVSYLTTSAIPGTIGNTVIYGHNRKDILGKLPNISIGDIVYVIMQDGRIVKYEVFERKEIAPTQVEILENSTDSRLTIYTCSGFLDQSRFVIIAKNIS